MMKFFVIPPNISIVERQRIYVFLYTSFGFLLGTLVDRAAGLGLRDDFLVTADAVHAVVILALIGSFWQKIIPVKSAVILLALAIQLEISAEMLHISAAYAGNQGLEVILGNTVLLGLLFVLSVLAYIPYLQYVQTALIVVTYIACWKLSGHAYLIEFLPVIVLSGLTISFLSGSLIRNVALLERQKEQSVREKNKTDTEVNRLLTLLDMEKPDLMQLVKLIRRKKLSDKQTIQLLDLLGSEAKQYIIAQTRAALQRETRDMQTLKKHPAGLTAVECEVCWLVLEDKSASEIGKMTGRSMSTITGTRSRIRAKLGLKPGDNLKDALTRITGQQGFF